VGLAALARLCLDSQHGSSYNGVTEGNKLHCTLKISYWMTRLNG